MLVEGHTKGESFTLRASFRIFRGEKAFGPGIAMLLNHVAQTGSLHRAAQEMKISYSKAFGMIKGCEKSLGFLLLERQIGGVKGGGSVLTPEATRLIAAYEDFCKEAQTALQAVFARYFSDEQWQR